MNKPKAKVYRQGDVLITQCNEIPKTAKKMENKKGFVTLAYGEVTGHHHSINVAENPVATGYTTRNRIDNNTLPDYLDVTEEAPLTHQEHDTIVLPEGRYKVTRQTEYTPEELRNVLD